MSSLIDKACDILQNMDIQFKLDNLGIKVDFIRIERFKPGMGFDDHAHSNFELHYIKSGYGSVTIEGKTFSLTPGSMYMTGSGVVHSQLASMESPMLEYAMKASIHLVNRLEDPTPNSEETYILSLLKNNPCFVVQDKSGLDGLFETLFAEALNMQPGFFGQIKALVYRIILAMARGLDTSLNAQYTVPSRHLNSYRVETARRYIQDNISQNVTCQVLSKHLYLSEKQLGRILRSETGLTTHELILNEKLKRVKELLATPELKLHSISDKTGFSSEFHLSTAFKKKMGVSPYMYKKQLKNAVETNSTIKSDREISFYPLKFRPLYKEYIWGGRNLEKFGKKLPENKVAESWEISAHHDGMSIIANGSFTGSTLEDVILEYGEAFLGTESFKRYKKRFPLLLKLIDANDWLSVQVHPDDTYAGIHENDLGKTEMWYILEADAGTHIIYGLNKSMSRDEFSACIEEGSIGECLRTVPVKKGDVVYIPAGTVHAAGKGILIAEVQQNSNATYRLYDYDRKNPDGTSRPLHIKKALETIDFGDSTRNGLYEGLPIKAQNTLTIRPIIADPHFCTDIVTLNGEAQFMTNNKSFYTYIVTEGDFEVIWQGGTMPVKAGESFLIPASMSDYTFSGNFTALRSYIGNTEADVIKPLKQAGYSEETIQSHIAGLK